MSLLRQLLLSVTVAIIAILVGTLIFSINGARDYLNAQLQAESDNAATSLALSLSQPANQDPALRELLVTALFDSGQFQLIELRDTSDQVLVSRQAQNLAEVLAPAWFSRLLPLQAPRAIRQVSDGWTQVGALTIVADDAAAKTALWNSSVRIFGWVVLAGVLWVAFVLLVLRWLKRALHKEITRQVDSVADGQAITAGNTSRQIAGLLPANHVIVQARERVQASKQEAFDRIESLTVELNHDAVTGLPNRRYFMNELRRALQSPDEQAAGQSAPGGYLLLCRQRDLAVIAAALPRDQVDGWLHSIGEQMTQTLGEFSDSSLQVGRLNGSDFAVLIADTPGPQAMLIAQAIRRTLLGTRVAVGPRQQCRWAFAMTDFVAGDELPEVFARLDTALMGGESAGHDNVETLLRAQFGAGTARRAFGETAWRTLLTNALSQNSLSLAVQQVSYGPKQLAPDRFEATLSLSDPSHNDGEALSGFSFMPVAVRLGLSAEFDINAVQLALAWLQENPGEIVVRVSAPSMLKPGFTQALGQILGSQGMDQNQDAGATAASPAPALLSRLIIELDAYGLSAYPVDVQDICKVIHKAGVRVGLRGVAQQLDAVARLQGLPLAYIKLGGGFMGDLETSQGAISLLNAVIHTAMALRIKVLVDETPGEVAAMLLRDHGAMLRS